MGKDAYVSPFSTRYASGEMQYLFSEDNKFKTWRGLWVILAKSERALGLNISEEQINELERFQNEINYEDAEEREKEIRHDVMAHIYAYGLQCPGAKPVIHLGATSCYVGDNTDIIIYRDALRLIRGKIISVIGALAGFAETYKNLPALGFTHFQPAQLVTVGKRAALWIQDLMTDWDELDHVLDNLSILGSKGTTGTQASFKELFDGDFEKALRLDQLVAEQLGFARIVPVSGQTYSRKTDSRVMNVLSGVAQSAAKFSNDIRLLQHLKEIEEPFEPGQVGSSAMAYKRNPMRCERMAALCRYVVADAQNAAMTASAQWFERTLDDSANKRIAVSEAFLAADAILNLYLNVSNGLVVYPKMIERHIMEELPFMATENILMAAVKRGGDRQALHERIREHSMAAALRVKAEGGKNDLLERIAADPMFGLNAEALSAEMSPELFTGFAAVQTERYLAYVNDRLAKAGCEAAAADIIL
ncbi:MAG: adenylosuccinate lyase [Clostridiales bacterium]|jgi:adenylosuccinate lyase|nr:adenylosuccinate lyase [Clostridiales bacterium]